MKQVRYGGQDMMTDSRQSAAFPLSSPVPLKLYYVYALINPHHEVYIGYTANALQRIASHNYGDGAASTRGRGPWVLFYLECFADERDARERESEMIHQFRKDGRFLEATYQSRRAAVRTMNGRYEDYRVTLVNGRGRGRM